MTLIYLPDNALNWVTKQRREHAFKHKSLKIARQNNAQRP